MLWENRGMTWCVGGVKGSCCLCWPGHNDWMGGVRGEHNSIHVGAICLAQNLDLIPEAMGELTMSFQQGFMI